MRTYRSISMECKEIEFSGGFTDLHTVTYKETLEGRGFRLEDARSSIETVYHIRNSTPIGRKGNFHPFLKNSANKHDFIRSIQMACCIYQIEK
jgi:UDP-N-acetyl-2-amino-2-deoxyglucuronate dehydrogenase